MTNIFLKIMPATAANILPKNQWGCVNTCKPTVYKTNNSMKTKTKRAAALLLMLALLVSAKAWAQSFGGGGHPQAAGINMYGNLDEKISEVLEAMIYKLNG